MKKKKDDAVRALLNSLKNISSSRQFHNETKLADFQNVHSKSPASWPASWKEIHYKACPRLRQIPLPTPEKPDGQLHRAVLQRQSHRDFSNKPVTLSKLSTLLYYSAGLKSVFDTRNKTSKRMYPSAGARYPLEIYPFIFSVQGLKRAIYHYHVKTHSLELIYDGIFQRATLKNFSQSWIRKAAFLLVITAIFDRMEEKYKERGYRHIYTEYGHLAQNFYLVSSSLDLGCCSIGGFIDDGLNELLDLDGVDESTVGVTAFGNIRSKRE